MKWGKYRFGSSRSMARLMRRTWSWTRGPANAEEEALARIPGPIRSHSRLAEEAIPWRCQRC